MKTKIGLWIDHHKAVVVALTDDGEESTLVITSELERQLGRQDGKRSLTPYEPQLVPADDRQVRKFTKQLDLYYDAVLACVRNAEAILIFGPGEAKGELRKRIVKAGINSLIEEAETTDKMTNPQIAAKVRGHFRGDEKGGNHSKKGEK